jgi:hypothetical protein
LSESPRLKVLIVYDAGRNEYTVSDHNLEPERAAQLVAEWQPHLRPGCRFIALKQDRKHRTPDARNCRACRDQVRLSSGLEPPPKLRRRDV